MKPVPFDTLTWLNTPQFTTDGDTLTVVTDDDTDFWQKTFYGFVHDNGHFGYTEVTGDFSLELSFSAAYDALYDQAGLMVRFDPETWLKAGVEFTDGLQHLSVVVTRGASDWSVIPLYTPPDEVRLRVTRLGKAMMLEYALDLGAFSMLRLAPLTDAPKLHVGVMCCSPKRAGFKVTFRNLKLGVPVSAELHTS